VSGKAITKFKMLPVSFSTLISQLMKILIVVNEKRYKITTDKNKTTFN